MPTERPYPGQLWKYDGVKIVIAAMVIVALGLAVLAVADHVIRPALIGGATELPFIWVLFGILGGVETFGLLGLFLGPALMAALVLLWRELTAGSLTLASRSEQNPIKSKTRLPRLGRSGAPSPSSPYRAGLAMQHSISP